MAKRTGKSKKKSPSPDPGRVRGWRVAFLVLCTAGLLLQADLVRLHVNVHTDPDYQSYCAMSEKVNCETVAASDHAVLFGLPLAMWGVLTYLLLGALAVWGLGSRLRRPTWPFGLLLAGSLLASLFSLYLLYVSHFLVQSICLVCVASYVVNLLLLFVSWMELRRLGARPGVVLIDELAALRERPARFLAVAGTLVLAAGALWIGVPRYWEVGGSPTPDRVARGAKDGHPWIGAENPRLEIVEYSDYQCPHCRRGHEAVRALLARHPDDVRIVHRNFPLDHQCNEIVKQSFHPHACAYARLAHCAGEQDRFWQVNDYLFANGRRRDPVTAREIAAREGLDAERLAACVDSEAAVRVVADDLRDGRALGIRGTPTFVIDGKIHVGRIPPELIRSYFPDDPG